MIKDRLARRTGTMSKFLFRSGGSVVGGKEGDEAKNGLETMEQAAEMRWEGFVSRRKNAVAER